MSSHLITPPEQDTPAVVFLSTATTPTYVQTVVGKQSSLSTSIEEFRGIPYGFVQSRWEHSHLRTHLPCDVFDATRNGPRCPQPSSRSHSKDYQAHVEFPKDVQESEFDCLNLFIVRPTPDAQAQNSPKLPVLLYIHGGAYGFGAATDPIWDPSQLVLQSMRINKPFIAVCINYRLNLFGFAASSDLLSDQSGSQLKGLNFGMRDQKVALAWVSRNISAFGGDPEKITLAGQSAGSHSVHVHLLESDLGGTKPLFRKAIMQSGAVGVLGPCSLERANRNWEMLHRTCDVHEEDIIERVNQMRQIPAGELLETGEKLGWFEFPLVIDNTTVSSTDLGCLVKIDMGHVSGSQLRAKDGRNDSPELMIGYVDTEVHSFDEICSVFRAAYPSSAACDEILTAYQLHPNIQLEMLHDRLLELLSDIMFNFPIFEARNFFHAHRQKRYHPVNDESDPAFSANLDQPGIHFYNMKFGNPFPGLNFDVAHHCVDLIYIFDAFHNDLESLDAAAQNSSSTSLTSSAGEEIGSDGSGVGSGIESSEVLTKKPAEEGDVPSQSSLYAQHQLRSNAELREEIQNHWISFIFDDNDDPLGEHHRLDEELITVWGRDRHARAENLSSDPKWIKYKRRLETIGKDLRSAKAVLGRISGIQLV
ncbi:carboxylesterase [Penicillium verhagenii]|nr:carboxylesterase [Penicillium verhagenii]